MPIDSNNPAHAIGPGTLHFLETAEAAASSRPTTSSSTSTPWKLSSLLMCDIALRISSSSLSSIPRRIAFVPSDDDDDDDVNDVISDVGRGMGCIVVLSPANGNDCDDDDDDVASTSRARIDEDNNRDAAILAAFASDDECEYDDDGAASTSRDDRVRRL